MNKSLNWTSFFDGTYRPNNDLFDWIVHLMSKLYRNVLSIITLLKFIEISEHYFLVSLHLKVFLNVSTKWPWDLKKVPKRWSRVLYFTYFWLFSNFSSFIVSKYKKLNLFKIKTRIFNTIIAHAKCNKFFSKC